MLERSGQCAHGAEVRIAAADLLLGGWAPPHPTFYARRSLVDAVGRKISRTDFVVSADYDFMLRALELRLGEGRNHIPLYPGGLRWWLAALAPRGWRGLWRNNVECLTNRAATGIWARVSWIRPLSWKPASKLFQFHWRAKTLLTTGDGRPAGHASLCACSSSAAPAARRNPFGGMPRRRPRSGDREASSAAIPDLPSIARTMVKVTDYFSPPDAVLQAADTVTNFVGLTKEVPTNRP